MKPLHKTLVAVLCLCALVAGFSLWRILNPVPASTSGDTAGGAPPAPESLVGQQRPAFRLPDLDDTPRAVAEWDGRVLLINFWATWCKPCREEIPLFQQWRARYPRETFEVIGIALDRRDSVAEFARELDIGYPLLYGSDDATAVLEAYGNRLGTLPYTVVVAADGTVAGVHAQGALDRAGLSALLEPHLPAPGGGAPE